MTRKELLSNVTYKLIEDQKISALAERIPHKTITGYLVTYNYRNPAMENFSVIISYSDMENLRLTEAELDEAARNNTQGSITGFIDMIVKLEALEKISRMNSANNAA